MVPRSCWCGAAEAAPLFEIVLEGGVRLAWVRCAGCGVEALHPTPAPEFLRPYYAGEYYGSSPKKFIGPIAKLVEYFQSGRARLVSRHVPRGGRVLDVGCGNGGFLRQLSQLGYAVEGTEWTAESAARVPAEWNIPVHVGDLLDIDLRAEQYDAVTAWHVFEHLAKPDETMARMRALLAGGGTLMLSMPNHESWQARLSGRHWFHLDPPRHLHGFGPRALSLLLRRHGFEIIQQHTWSFEQNPFGVIQSELHMLGFPAYRAYGVLKGTSSAGAGTRLLDLALIAVLALPALKFSVIESLFGRGGTMTVVARKR